MDIYDRAAWTEVDIEDLKVEIEHGRSIEEAGEFLCRADSVDEVSLSGHRTFKAKAAFDPERTSAPPIQI